MNLFNFLYEVTDIECPNCGYDIKVLIKQIVFEEMIICPGCLKEIQLIDENSALKGTLRSFEELSDV